MHVLTYFGFVPRSPKPSFIDWPSLVCSRKVFLSLKDREYVFDSTSVHLNYCCVWGTVHSCWPCNGKNLRRHLIKCDPHWPYHENYLHTVGPESGLWGPTLQGGFQATCMFNMNSFYHYPGLGNWTSLLQRVHESFCSFTNEYGFPLFSFQKQRLILIHGKEDLL